MYDDGSVFGESSVHDGCVLEESGCSCREKGHRTTIVVPPYAGDSIPS